MFTGKLVFAQLMQWVPHYHFHRIVKRYKGNYKVSSFTCWDQFLCIAFAQLTYRESLRDIEACLNSRPNLPYHQSWRKYILECFGKSMGYNPNCPGTQKTFLLVGLGQLFVRHSVVA